MITFSSFLTAVKTLAHPEGLAENLEPYFRNAVVNGLIDLQTYVPPTRNHHHDFFCQVGMKDFCNAGIFNGPRGIVQSVYAFKPGKDCQKFHYDRVSTNYIDCWIERQRCACGETVPASSSIYDAPYCNYPTAGNVTCGEPYLPAGESEDNDACFQAEDRWFAVGPDYRMFIAPRLPCGYVLAVHWQGIKRCYGDNDSVLEDEDIKMAVADFSESRGGLKDRDLGSASAMKVSWHDRLRGIAHRFRMETRLQPRHDCSSEAIDALLPFINPLVLDNPYDLSCNKPADSTAPTIDCDDAVTATVPVSACKPQIVIYTADPTAEALVPDNQNCPAMAYRADGQGPILTWNITTHVWQ